jgi:hypothetical protein
MRNMILQHVSEWKLLAILPYNMFAVNAKMFIIHNFAAKYVDYGQSLKESTRR